MIGDLNTGKVRTGGHYCLVCKKCTSQPRVRKYLTAEYWHVCEQCEKKILTFNFCPSETSLRTKVQVKYKDLDLLIKELLRIQKDILRER